MEMRPKGMVVDRQQSHLLYQLSQESTFLKQVEQRQARNLDADYSKVEMESYVDSLDHLDSSHKKEQLANFNQFPTILAADLVNS